MHTKFHMTKNRHFGEMFNKNSGLFSSVYSAVSNKLVTRSAFWNV